MANARSILDAEETLDELKRFQSWLEQRLKEVECGRHGRSLRQDSVLAKLINDEIDLCDYNEKKIRLKLDGETKELRKATIDAQWFIDADAFALAEQKDDLLVRITKGDELCALRKKHGVYDWFSENLRPLLLEAPSTLDSFIEVVEEFRCEMLKIGGQAFAQYSGQLPLIGYKTKQLFDVWGGAS